MQVSSGSIAMNGLRAVTSQWSQVPLMAWCCFGWSLHVLPVNRSFCSGYSGLIPQAKSMHARLTGKIKLFLGVVDGENGCLYMFL